MVAPLTLLAVAVLAYALVSRRLSGTIVTAPMFFVAVGLVAGPVLGLVDLAPGSEPLVLLLEAALVMVLFADASALDVRRWTREPALSARLLGIGLPLTMLAGTGVALLLFPGLEPWQAGLIGVILAPTDAALGQAVVANPRVPAVVRNALNVESGLNDGLALPFVVILITVGEVAMGAEAEPAALATLAWVLAGSVIVGLGVGLGAGWLIRAAIVRGLAGRRYQGVALVAVAVAGFSIADHAEASGFLAVWIAGLVTGTLVREHIEADASHLSEHAADVLGAIGFLMLGAGLVAPMLARLTPEIAVYAVLSLTAIRILPVAASMLGTGFAPPTVAYVAWFGPRGLASIVFAGAVVEAALPGSAAVTDVVLLTVILSIVAHGVTAAWGARRYAAWFERAAAAAPELPEARAVPDDGVAAARAERARGGA